MARLTALSFVLIFAFGMQEFSSGGPSWWSTIGLALIFGTGVILDAIRRRASLLDQLGLTWDRGAAGNLLAGAAMSVAALLGILVVGAAAGIVEPRSLEQIPLVYLSVLLVYSVINAAFQELIYRSMQLGGLLLVLRRRPWWAITASAAVFGLAHASNGYGSADVAAREVMAASLWGIVLGIAFARGERIYLPVGLHAGWNYAYVVIFGAPAGYGGLFGYPSGHWDGVAAQVGSDLAAGLVRIAFLVVILGLVVAWLGWSSRSQGPLGLAQSAAAIRREVLAISAEREVPVKAA